MNTSRNPQLSVNFDQLLAQIDRPLTSRRAVLSALAVVLHLTTFKLERWLAAAQVQGHLRSYRDVDLLALPNDREFLQVAQAHAPALLTSLELHREWSTLSVAAAYRVNPDLVEYVRRQLHVLPRGRPVSSFPAEPAWITAWSPEVARQVLRMLAEGLPMRTVAIGCGVRLQVLKRCLHSLGVTSYQGRAPRRPIPSTSAAARQWYLDALICQSVRQARELWCCSDATARARLLAVGVHYPPASQTWLKDLQTHGTISATAKAWGVTYQRAYQRARSVGWKAG